MKFKSFSVDHNNLLPFLSPTSEGTNWFDPPPPSVSTNRGVGRLLLQFHQLAEYASFVFERSNCLKFIDIGTGNGVLPNLVSDYLGASLSIGLDPYEDGEHTTSWARDTREGLLNKLQKRIPDNNFITYEAYSELLAYEEHYRRPSPVPLRPKANDWQFVKSFIEDYNTTSRFNLFFAKCIDHIHDWNSLFTSAASIAEPGALFVIKHNSFFGFNGAHRYASTFIPWGHVVLSETEYKQYAQQFHPDRYDSMLDFYYSGLSYPRKTLSSLIHSLTSAGWTIKSVEKSVTKSVQQKIQLAGGLSQLEHHALAHFPDLSLDELLSGRIFIVAEYL